MSASAILAAMQPVLATQTMTDSDGANLLILMNDATVRQKVGEAFTAQMQHSGRVQSTFFGSPAALLAPLPESLNDWVGQMASALVALALAQCSSHGFSGTVNAGQAQAFLNSNLTPGNASFVQLAMSNYQSLFPTYCSANNVTFGSFLAGTYGDSTRWGTVLANALTRPAYINQEVIKLNAAVDPGGWYQVFFANLYKVKCLNPTAVQGVLDTWAPQLQGKQVPGQIVPWTVYDHMVAGSYSLYTFMGQAQAAIAVSHSDVQLLGCHGGIAASCSSITTTTYGAAVNDWLSNNRGLGGFINGPSGSNQEVLRPGSGLCGCFVAGTPILMADGTTRAIERVQANDAVVSRDGTISNRSTQDVHWRIDPHELLYGINDMVPFFNASHPFMTTEGWKSMSPKASRRINPDLQVGQLKEGDVLLQVAEQNPLRYREVKVEVITKVTAEAADTSAIYSLHLAQENLGYHANGFLVAVNYPQLREEHFVRAFAGITEAERCYLRAHLDPLVPFLRRGLGNYVSEILRRALGSADETQPIGAPSHRVEYR